MNDKSLVVRVMLSNLGLEGRDQGSKEVAHTLRNAGMNVIYTGNHSTPAEIVQAAVEEDVDALGVNFISDANITNISQILKLLRESDALDIEVFVCGVINHKQVETLKSLGVSEILHQDTPSDKIVSRLQKIVSHRK